MKKYLLILCTEFPPKVVLVIFSTVITGFRRFLVTTRWKGWSQERQNQQDSVVVSGTQV